MDSPVRLPINEVINAGVRLNRQVKKTTLYFTERNPLCCNFEEQGE
jgi:hypothetical protein